MKLDEGCPNDVQYTAKVLKKSLSRWGEKTCKKRDIHENANRSEKEHPL